MTIILFVWLFILTLVIATKFEEVDDDLAELRNHIIDEEEDEEPYDGFRGI